MSWREKVKDKNIYKNVNELLSDLLTNVESDLSQSGSGSSNNNNENSVSDEVVFKQEKISKSIESKNVRFKRGVKKTTYKIDHNFGSFTDLYQIESNIDNLYETFINEHLSSNKSSDIVSCNIFRSELNNIQL